MKGLLCMNDNIIDTVICGDSCKVLNSISSNSINLVYLDPPFFSQKEHELSSRTDGKKYSFDDLLNLMKKDKKNSNDYIKFVILESMH